MNYLPNILIAQGKFVSRHGSSFRPIFNNPKQLDIDHLVPLKEAHDSGAHAWSKSKKRDYANEMSHLDHLMAVVSEVNRSKGAKDPAEWLPLDQFYWNESIHVWNG